MISIRAINRQPGWLVRRGPCNGAALLASHSLVGIGLISQVPSLGPPPPSSLELHGNMARNLKSSASSSASGRLPQKASGSPGRLIHLPTSNKNLEVSLIDTTILCCKASRGQVLQVMSLLSTRPRSRSSFPIFNRNPSSHRSRSPLNLIFPLRVAGERPSPPVSTNCPGYHIHNLVWHYLTQNPFPREKLLVPKCVT